MSNDRCESGACIEVEDHDGHIRVSSTVTGTVMQCTPAELAVFIEKVKRGDFDEWAHIGVSEVAA